MVWYREAAHRLKAAGLRRSRDYSSVFWVVAMIVCAGHPASGQPGSNAAQPGNAAQTLEAMKGDLRRLVGANQVYFADNGRYSAEVSALRGYHPSPGVTVNITQASSTGWAAEATAATVPGKSCVISVGSVAHPPSTLADKRSGPEAVAVCDNP